MPDAKFHEPRHSHTVNVLQIGDTAKNIQEQLGHYGSAFPMDTYAAVSETMRKASQEKMEQFIKEISAL